MRLYLAVAVLMLAFVAYTEAQDDAGQDRLATIRAQVQENLEAVRVKTLAAIDQLQKSEAVATMTTWWNQAVETAKAKLQEISTQ